MHAVLTRDRLQLRERLERRFAQSLVTRDVMGRARRLAFLVDVGRVDREHLTFEATLGPRLLRALLRLEPECVGVGAGDAPLLGDALCAFELRRQLVVLAVRGWVGPAEIASRRGTERDPAHRLDAARQRGVDHAGSDHRCREVGRLLRRSALAVDRGRGDFEWEPGAQPGRACDVERLLTDLADAPTDHLTDLERVDPGPVDRGLLHRPQEHGRVHGGEPSVAPAERGSHRFDHYDVVVGEFCHCTLPLG